MNHLTLTQNLKRVEEDRELADRLKEIAQSTLDEGRSILFTAAKRIDSMAASTERKAKTAEAEPAVAVLATNATGAELKHARRRQAARRGRDVFLPEWPGMTLLPKAFLRSALFSTNKEVQASSGKILTGNLGRIGTEKKIRTPDNISVLLNGYELCQLDRRVYSTCLEYYRDRPLEPDGSQQSIETTFYEFTKRMGQAYGLNPHKALRASLLRLSFAQLRVRDEKRNVEISKLLGVNFLNGSNTGEFKGSDTLQLQIFESVAELFGPGAWTAVDRQTASYDGLMGWLANYYASHSQPYPLPIKDLYELSGYGSHNGNFNASLRATLERLKGTEIPHGCRVQAYYSDGKKIIVHRVTWSGKPMKSC